ncbi:MAG: tRNA (adenosine(37)-N6)-threonylcarbamoyltransferase complex dimerization subunit type 1 TsaB, partial [Paraglaciecola sp.]|nr:tRNA (adenosine(37)-N6)-threonylcarbamoyltransferase complex dimerization subunit type 1 TsaB [Paraglaciecola sp.]
MNCLLLDTATEACSVALQIQGQALTRFEICPQQHSQRILPMV